jgi:N6-L-threonylcarbamoyladenine synthase
MLLSIESSCDETSVALFKMTDNISELNVPQAYCSQIIKSQIASHKEYGGVVPELAARQHMECLPMIVDLLLEQNSAAYKDIKYVAVTAGPGLKGCLLVGLSYTKGLSESLNIPLIPINHLEGHILSYSVEYEEDEAFPKLCLLVSGGHSEIILINKIGDYKILCQTSDDAAGEAFDKIGTLLGIDYPAGKELSELAKTGVAGIFTFPEGVQRDYESFSFSGLKTSVRRAVELHKSTGKEVNAQFKADVAYAVQEAIVNSLIKKLAYWTKEVAPKSIVLAGGVAANHLLRDQVKALCTSYNIEAMIPSFEFCTDNAAMVGAAALMKMKHGLVNLENKLESRLVGARARWSVEISTCG